MVLAPPPTTNVYCIHQKPTVCPPAHAYLLPYSSIAAIYLLLSLGHLIEEEEEEEIDLASKSLAGGFGAGGSGAELVTWY